MAISRKGIYIDDYLDYTSTFPAEIQRLLNTIRELDERSTSMINQTRQSTRDCLGLASRGSKKVNRNSAYSCNYINTKEEDDATSEKMLKEIEANQDSVLSFCTEKVLLVQQAYDLIDSHIKRLDEDLNNFSEDIKQEGKIPPDEPAILPSMPLVPKSEKWKSLYGTPLSKRLDYREDWDRESRRDFELMPPPGSYKEYAAPTGIDQPIGSNEPIYCLCHQVLFCC